MTEELFLISDVARRLNVRPHRVAYLFLTRKLVEPKLRMGNRRIFTNADAERVATALGLTWEPSVKEAQP
jgi:DNA-binding transcriptional MerR regulator